MNLRARMLALFFGLGVLPLLVLGVVSYRQSMDAVEELLATETASIAERAARELEGRFARYQSDLTLLAENLETLSLFRAHYDGGDVSWENAFQNADAYLRQLWEQYRISYRWIEFRDTAGGVVYTLGEPGGERVSGSEPAGVPIQQGFPFRRPVPNPHGSSPLGEVVAMAPMDQVLPPDALSQAFGRSGYSVVLDLDGDRVLSHPRPSQVQARANSLVGPDGWGLHSATLARERGSFVFRAGDSAHVASFVTMDSPPWTVISAAALEEFSGPFARMRRLHLIVVGLVTAAVFFAFLLMTARATRSLRDLTRAADAVAAGDYSPPLPPSGRDEVGRLSAAFGVMAGRVEETLRRIQESRHMAVIGEFTSRLSHEVRNPLTSVKLNLQRIERHAAKGKLPDECLGPLEISLSEVDRLDRVVRGVLSLARTGAHATDPCFLHQILRRAVETVRLPCQEKRIEIEEDLGAGRDAVLGNAEALEGVFLNLLLNAADAMPEGGRITVVTKNVPGPETEPERIRVEVRDEGPGIPPDLADRIFEPFFSTRSEGTGFGLPVALSTVEDHGGTFRLDRSREGERGAVFVVELPLAGFQGYEQGGSARG
jgi:signal transduction histidine kinase